MLKFSFKLVAFTTALLLIGGCVSNPSKTNISSNLSNQPKKPPVTWVKTDATDKEVEFIKNKVTETLKDPESARFSDIWALQGSNEKRVFCGYVNAKNSYGGYTGKKMFIVMQDTVTFEGKDILNRMVPTLCSPRIVG